MWVSSKETIKNRVAPYLSKLEEEIAFLSNAQAELEKGVGHSKRASSEPNVYQIGLIISTESLAASTPRNLGPDIHGRSPSQRHLQRITPYRGGFPNALSFIDRSGVSRMARNDDKQSILLDEYRNRPHQKLPISP